MARRQSCEGPAYKQALKQLIKETGYTRANRVPKHVRVALRSHATHLSKVICGTLPERNRAYGSNTTRAAAEGGALVFKPFKKKGR